MKQQWNIFHLRRCMLNYWNQKLVHYFSVLSGYKSGIGRKHAVSENSLREMVCCKFAIVDVKDLYISIEMSIPCGLKCPIGLILLNDTMFEASLWCLLVPSGWLSLSHKYHDQWLWTPCKRFMDHFVWHSQGGLQWNICGPFLSS